MKKTLVVLLALVMVFAFATTAMAADTQYVPYGDIATQDADTQTAIERLSILGALKGYNAEGTIYAPANLITREEFATIGVRIAGLEDQVALYASLATAFKDVEEGRWSEGYVNCANANGIMIGRGAGVFDPKANVTMQEVVTVLLRAVGYTDQLKGSWPTDYNRKAVGVGLTEFVDFIGPKYATRGEVAALVNEAIDLYIVYYVDNEFAQGIGQIGWGPDGVLVDEDGFAYKVGKTNEFIDYIEDDWVTLLNETFDCYEAGELTFYDEANSLSEAMAWDVVDFDDWELEAYFWDTYWDGDEVDYYGNGYFTAELASLYGVSGGQDLTDLGYQVADITFNADDEIVYITTTSTITRTADADKDYDETAAFSDVLLEEKYGEVWYYDWSGKGTKDLANYYAAKDFSNFEDWTVRIVADVDADGWECFADEDYDFDKDDYVYYLVGTGFIDGADLEVNDVVYWEYLDGDTDGLFLVFRPEAGTLDDYGTDFIEVDDEEYGAIFIDDTPVDFYNSFYSIDKGNTIEYYTDSTVLTVEFSDSIYWAPAYAFINFSYFYDSLQMYNYGIIDSYIFGSASAKDRLNENTNIVTVTGMNVLLPGDTELTEIAFADPVRAADLAEEYPEEGSLAEFVLNTDGEFTSWYPNNNDIWGHSWQKYSFWDDVLDGVFFEPILDCEDEHGLAVGNWTAKGRLDLSIFYADPYTPGDPDDDASSSDTYTFADDAVIFLVESTGDAADPDYNFLYDFDSAECLTYEDFMALGDFTARDLCIYEADGREISVLYVCDWDDADTEDAYGFGLYTGYAARSISLDAYYLVIGGKVVLVDSAVFQELGDQPGLVAYKTTDGTVEADDFLLFNNSEGDTKTAIDAYYNASNDWYDELDLEIALGAFDVHTGNDATFAVLYDDNGVVSSSITLFYGDLIDSYDYVEEAAVDFDYLDTGDYAVIVYDADSENDLLYLLLDPNQAYGD